jgi:hypothetical protein
VTKSDCAYTMFPQIGDSFRSSSHIFKSSLPNAGFQKKFALQGGLSPEAWYDKLEDALCRGDTVVMKAIKQFPHGRNIIKNAQAVLSNLANAKKSAHEAQNTSEHIYSFGDEFVGACAALVAKCSSGALSQQNLQAIFPSQRVKGLLQKVVDAFYHSVFHGEERDGMSAATFKERLIALHGCKLMLQAHEDAQHWQIVEEISDMVRFVSVYETLETDKAVPEDNGAVIAEAVLNGLTKKWEVLFAWVNEARNVSITHGGLWCYKRELSG